MPSIVISKKTMLSGAGRISLLTALKEGNNNPSPNAGLSEAAFAGALNVKLGGPNIYKGRIINKPVIGAGLGDIDVEDIRRACDLMVISSIVSFIACWGAGFFHRLFI